MFDEVKYEFEEEMFPNNFDLELEEIGYSDDVLTLVC